MHPQLGLLCGAALPGAFFIRKTSLIQKHDDFLWFLKAPSIDLGSSWGSFWGHLGGPGAVLEASWASSRRLGTSGSAWER